jgi:hypothetical protein
MFDVVRWFKSTLTWAYGRLCNAIEANAPEYDILRLLDRGKLTPAECQLDDVARRIYTPPPDAKVMCRDTHLFVLELNGQQIPVGTYLAIHRTTVIAKDFKRVIPKPVVVTVHINGHLARALIDSGSLSDFMSVTLADQLKIPRIELAKPIVMQLAVQGSRSKVNHGVTANLKYQSINSKRYFDIINLQNYDLVLGTPFLFQHKVMIGLNPPRVVIGSVDQQPMKGEQVTTLESCMLEVYEENLDKVHAQLNELAQPLCAKASETNLPPLRVINHTIPLIDEGKIYPWRPSRCPEPMRPHWADKCCSYLASGRWQVTSAGNTVPILFIRKPGSDRLRTVVDLHEQNKNTRKLTSPLPDMEGILRRVARKKFKSILDGQDAYEQIRVVPEHVHHTAMTTPDGNMVSHVLQQGNCNAPATYQALMNHLFGEYLGKWMDVYLDDITIYSDILHEHIDNVKTVLKILEQEKLYLSQKKIQFLCNDVKILGCIVGRDGIRMDPEKVDSILKWKTLTNCDLCWGFIRSVGYLADDIYRIQIPLGVLSEVTGDTVPFKWDYAQQRAFETIKQYVATCAPHCRVPLVYGLEAPPIYMMTDACLGGIGGVIAQGADWRTAKVATCYSAKLNPAQRNYPVHEQEMLAGVETML